jgi:hypothetical protein
MIRNRRAEPAAFPKLLSATRPRLGALGALLTGSQLRHALGIGARPSDHYGKCRQYNQRRDSGAHRVMPEQPKHRGRGDPDEGQQTPKFVVPAPRLGHHSPQFPILTGPLETLYPLNSEIAIWGNRNVYPGIGERPSLAEHGFPAPVPGGEQDQHEGE